MQAAQKQAYRERTEQYPRPSTDQESGRPIEDWEIKWGKMIFYITVASGVWFFYWLNGIQCPC